MILLFWTLSILLSILASGHAILRRRDPRAALWWVGVSWMLPIVGASLYYFFGINRIERRAVRLRRRHAVPPHPSPALMLSRAGDPDAISPRMRYLSSLSRLVESVAGWPLLFGNAVQPLVNGEEAYPAMLKAIREAEHSIGLATYIFNRDRVGEEFIDALAGAVRRRVEVRVLIDDVGAGFFWSTVHRRLSQAGVPVAYFMPSFVPLRMPYLNMRNHRKILTVDGRLGFVGGMNIAEGHRLDLNPRHPMQDVQFQVEGPVVAQMQEVFREDWYFTTSEVLSGPAWFPDLREVGSLRARGIPDGPDEDFEKSRFILLGAVANAQTSVKIVTPYFVPEISLVNALNVAAMSGVKVDIVLPQENDLAFVKWASHAVLWQVLERGCRVWFSPPPFDHGKLMTVDGGWTFFGSSNWDTRSLRLNFEFNIECYDETLVAKIDALVDQKIAASRPITLSDVDGRSLPVRLRDGIARLFAPHL